MKITRVICGAGLVLWMMVAMWRLHWLERELIVVKRDVVESRKNELATLNHVGSLSTNVSALMRWKMEDAREIQVSLDRQNTLITNWNLLFERLNNHLLEMKGGR